MKTWIVIVYSPKGRRTRVKVRAVYYKEENGSLVFRVPAANTVEGYPVPVHRFAAGHWCEVIASE